jgi:hypothetical protein
MIRECATKIDLHKSSDRVYCEQEVAVNSACGWSRTDVLATLATTAVLSAVGVSYALADPSGRTERLLESLANLRAIGAAINEYRADNDGYLPLEPLSSRRPSSNGQGWSGYASWQFGGKNCNSYWFSVGVGVYDVEAADRPLNSYLYHEFVFFAPTPPQRLPANHPARHTEQARVFRDPADAVGLQESWPQRNSSGRSDYDSVGTSYHSNMNWFSQLQGGFVRQFREGTRRLAVDQGVDPSRFVHVFDALADITVRDLVPNSQRPTNHGMFNQSVTLFADGHAGLITYRPGQSAESFINNDYALRFEEIRRPAAPRTPASIPPR